MEFRCTVCVCLVIHSRLIVLLSLICCTTVCDFTWLKERRLDGGGDLQSKGRKVLIRGGEGRKGTKASETDHWSTDFKWCCNIDERESMCGEEFCAKWWWRANALWAGASPLSAHIDENEHSVHLFIFLPSPALLPRYPFRIPEFFQSSTSFSNFFTASPCCVKSCSHLMQNKCIRRRMACRCAKISVAKLRISGVCGPAEVICRCTRIRGNEDLSRSGKFLAKQ